LNLLMFSILLSLLITKYYVVIVRTAIARFSANGEETEQIQRLGRITRNEVESLLPFCVVLSVWIFVVLYQSATAWNISTSMVGMWSTLLVYTSARIAYCACYYFEIQPYRTVAYAFGHIALGIMLFWTFGLLVQYYNTIPIVVYELKAVVAISALALIEVMRSIIVGILTGYFRLKEHNFTNAEDNRVFFKDFNAPDGAGPEEPELPKGDYMLSSILQNIHFSDISIQLIFLWVSFPYQPIMNDLNQANGVIAILCLFVIFQFFHFGAAVFMVRGQTLTTLVKTGLVGIALLWLIVGLLWAFISRIIQLSPAPPSQITQQ